jgi:hypothetical protein
MMQNVAFELHPAILPVSGSPTPLKCLRKV